MESSLKIALGIVAAALAIGLLGMPAIAQTGFGSSGMMGGGGFGGMMGSGKGGIMSGGMGGMMGSGLGGSGMMGAGMMGNAQGMTGTAGFGGMMGGAGEVTCGMHKSGSDASSGTCGMMENTDMNEMHRAMHGEDADVDMNQMHARMLAGNLTQEDLAEMREHCPMHGGNWTK